MAPIRAKSLPSISSPSVPAWEHPGVAGLIADAGGQEPSALLAALFGSRRAFGFRERLRAAVGGDDGGEIGELLGLECEELVAGLGRLQRAGSALALANQRGQLRAVGVDVADDARLHPHRVLQTANRVLPALAGLGDELGVRRGE
ncbi:hypothetical protein chiPu_0031896 [Chiloscyllium punctatum]|uniref:Uncharacterized protein n=1 Tax=Chiloscyllium punctatum TaxID=137246 RepID=A0A401TYY0_CHIPU|nr:hypothetical protein [Chiloscyllium punctatum]